MAIQLVSNVKIITTGVAPTTDAQLGLGQMAFGLIDADNKYHIYGNSEGTIIDLILASQGPVPTLQDVLTSGNTSTLSLVLSDSTAGTTITVAPDLITAAITGADARTLTMNPAVGFKDDGAAVLSANPDNTITVAEATTMRTFLDVYSKAEVDAKIAGVFTFRGTALGTVADMTELNAIVGPAEGDIYFVNDSQTFYKYDGTAWATLPAVVGDVWQADADGLMYAWDGDAWIKLGFTLDLSNYYTKAEVDALVQDIRDDIPTKTSDLTNDSFFMTDPTGSKDLAIAAIVLNGDGASVLTNDGTYQSIALVVGTI